MNFGNCVCVCVIFTTMNILSHKPVAFYNTATGLHFEKGGVCVGDCSPCQNLTSWPSELTSQECLSYQYMYYSLLCGL